MRKPFEKGNKLAKGGKRPGAGRKSNEERAIKKAASEIAKAYIEEHVMTVLGSYKKLIEGRIVRHFDKQTGNLICEEEVIDSAAVRHAMDTLVAKRASEDKEGNAATGPLWSLTIKQASE